MKYLDTEFIEPEIAQTLDVREYVSGMDSMDKQGLLTRILLREFSQLDAKLSPALTDPQARKETKAVTRLLKRFVERKEEELTGLDFIGSVFRISLMPIAKLTKAFDVSKVLKSASYLFADNIDTVYVLARGLNTEVAKSAVSEIEKAKLYLKNTDWEYNIAGRKGQIRSYVAELKKV